MTNAQHIQRLEAEFATLAQRPEAGAIQRIDLLNDLAWQLSDIEGNRAYALAEEAYALSFEPGDNGARYQAGIARSLRTLGYLNQRLGKHTIGLRQLLQALELCELLHLADLLPDVLDGIAGIYGQIGEFPTALDYIHRQLAAAQQIGDKRLIANAQNNLANLYWAMHDIDRFITTLKENLQIADEIGFDRIKILSFLNLADAYRMKGENEQALDYGRRALALSHAAGFAIFEIYANDITGKIYRQLGNAETALAYLENARELSHAAGSKVTETLILLGLGEAHRDLQRMDLALASFQRGAALAAEIDAKSELSTAYRLLAEHYEEMGDTAQALAYFKQHQVIREEVAGEKAEQRMQVLQVAYDTATARQEAENARLRSVELSLLNEQLEQQVAIRTAELTETVAQLQIEIAMRKVAEAETLRLVTTLEQRIAARTDELAALFDLTLLAGEATELDGVFDQALARIMELTRSRALCIHLFDGTGTELHLAGQKNLYGHARLSLQAVPLDMQFQRWMRAVNDPLVTTDLGSMSRLPAPFRLTEFQTYLGAQIKNGSHIEGLLSCYRHTDRGYGIDDIALTTALAELLGIMLESQRLRQNAEAVAALEERQRLAQDLHDSVSQSLYSLALFSRAGREAAEDGDTARLVYSLTELERNTLHALREMRLLLYELRPADLGLEGLARAIELRLESVERRVGLQLDVDMGKLPPMAPGIEKELYYIIAEALNNVVNHAAASNLGLRLHLDNGHLHLRITDDGKGFDAANARGGQGLRNIQERVARLDGRLTIVTLPGSGVQLDAVIPYPAETSE